MIFFIIVITKITLKLSFRTNTFENLSVYFAKVFQISDKVLSFFYKLFFCKDTIIAQQNQQILKKMHIVLCDYVFLCSK